MRIYSCILTIVSAFLIGSATSFQSAFNSCNARNKRAALQTRNVRSVNTPVLMAAGEVGPDGVTKGAGSDDVFEQLREKLRGTCVYFVGMMGSGKSTLGDAFAKKLGYRFLDTDEIAEFMIEMPISDYFAQGKVDEFRQLEYQILMELAQYTRVVVATGGGIVMKQENWGLLRHGIVVFVDMPVEDIYARLSADPAQIAKRPLLRESDPLEKLRKLSAERMDKYTQADIHLKVPSVPTSPEDLATLTAQSILDFIANNPPLWETWKKKREMIAVEAAGRVS
jgi:shikimate kinase